LHGGTGENGAVQGLLEVMGIPYTGSGVLASALAMDKEASKKIFSYHGLPMAPSIIVVKKKGKKSKSAENLPDATGAYMFPGFPVPPFGPPWVVKPSSEGSSIGVEIIKEESGLEPCLGKAFSFDNRVIIEQFIKGRELHIAVLGNRVLGGVEVRPSLEFYNYEAKYTSGLTDYILPPEIEEEVYENVKEMALKAHLVLGCSGASRVDFILDGNNSPYVLEVNTLPGMTTTSLLPKIARSGGMSFNDLIEEMIKLAL
ncbi:MAG TPA: D-alanine--D-alanine ligase, partial [Nitrospirae bacterium]|nr:D-alanine--D-alanine ligase [Nitrospirota bacterium]